MTDKPLTIKKDPWKYRRRFLFAYTAFVMIMVTKSVFLPTDVEIGNWTIHGDAEVAKVVISTGFTTLGGVVAAYVFGAAWERKALKDSEGE